MQPVRRRRRLRRLLETLETRRLLAIDLASGPVYVDTDDNKMLHSLAGDAVASGSDAGATLIVYADRDSGTGKGEDIYLRRINPDGTAYGSESLVNTTFSGAQMNPDIALTSLTNYAVVWQSQGQDGDGWGIYLRYRNSGGTTSETLVNTNTTGDQINPKVAMNASGDIVVTWLDAGSNNGEVFARRFDANGAPVGGAFKVSGSSTLVYAAPVVAMNAAGEFAVAWEARDPNGDNSSDVQLLTYNASGAAVGSIKTVNGVTTNDQAEPAIDSAGTGFVVAYSDNRDSQSRIYHRLYNNTGTATSTSTQSNQDGDGDRTRPVVAGDASGNFLVGWTQQPDGATYSNGVIRSYDKNNAATSNELAEGDGSSARTLFDVAFTGTGTFRDVASIGEDVGYGVGTTSGYANILDVFGDAAANTITVSELSAGTVIRVKNGIAQLDYQRSAYAYLVAQLGAGNDNFNASAVTSLAVSVTGGDGDDTIYGGAAGDSIFGEGGKDQIHGGASKDYIVGGNDNDQVWGDAGNDNCVGGAGKNTIFGGDGDDRITGSGGHDKFNGENGNDRLYGGAGNDTLDGGGGTDRLYGEDGTDSLMGGSSNDRLFGDAGNDTLIGGAGTDYLFGGADTDTRKSPEASDILDSIEVTG